MNDIILSSLLNLLALFSSTDKTDRELSKRVLVTYLTHHFGVKKLETYINFYLYLCGFYEDDDTIDRQSIVIDVCRKLVGQISVEEQYMMLLRLMEICAVDGIDNLYEELFIVVAKAFGIDHVQYGEFNAFIRDDQESETVRVIRKEGIDGFIKTIYIERFDLLLLSCHSSDILLLNDVQLLPCTFRVWQRSGALKSMNAAPMYYQQIIAGYDTSAVKNGNHADNTFIQLSY